MTKEEAVKELTEIRDYVHAKQDNEIFEADTTSLDMAIEALSAQKEGRWINVFCSECGHEAITEWNDCGGEMLLSNFCPNCGADMRREEQE